MNDQSEYKKRLESALDAALLYADPNGKKVFNWADPRVVIGEDEYLGDMLPHVIKAVLEVRYAEMNRLRKRIAELESAAKRSA